MGRLVLFLLAALLQMTPRDAQALVFVIPQPAGDKYMYPFIEDSLSQGRRDYASTFGAYGNIDDPGFNFDDRDAQLFLDFDTSAFVAPGRGASNYQVVQVVVTVVVQNHNAFSFDPTPDALPTFKGESIDADPGRPVELYGVGYRSGWSRATFNEDSIFQTEPSSLGQANWNRKRNAFAIDFDSNGQSRDVSNNVEENFEPQPWAVADSPGYIDFNGDYVADPLAPGSLVAEGRVLRFTLNASNARIRQYLQEGLNAGRLHLMVSSLMGTSRGSADVPKFYTKEAVLHDPAAGIFLAAQLQGEVSITDGVPPVPALSVSRPNSSILRVSFETQAGYQYVVESRDSLSSGNWVAKSQTYVGNGQVQIFDDSEGSPSGKRFYRVAVTAQTP